MTTHRLAALALTALFGAIPVASLATAAGPPQAGTWRFFDVAPAMRAAIETDLARVVPAAQPVVQSVAGAVAFDSEISHCRHPAQSCSIAHSGADGRWGIHLDAQTTSATFPSNRFLVYHEIGHAVWGLVLDDSHRRAFADAVRAALHGRRCVDDLGRPCAVLGEIFADEFARYAGGFAVSMSYYWTPSLLDPATFGALVGTP